MGKPRRCSAAFLNEERQILEEKRKKIRYLHQLKGFEVTDMSQFKGKFDNLFYVYIIYIADLNIVLKLASFSSITKVSSFHKSDLNFL